MIIIHEHGAYIKNCLSAIVKDTDQDAGAILDIIRHILD